MKKICIVLLALSLGFLTLCQPTFAITISPGESLWIQLDGATAPGDFDGMRLQWTAQWDGQANSYPDLDLILYGPPGYTGGPKKSTTETPSIVDLSIFQNKDVIFEFKNNAPGLNISLPNPSWNFFNYIFYEDAVPDWKQKVAIQSTWGQILASAPVVGTDIGNPLFIHYLSDVNFTNIAGATLQNTDFATVPEPATLLLLASGLLALAGGRRKFNKK